MKQTSGFDALIEALKQSGVNVDGRFDADHEAPSGGAGRAGGGGGGAQPPHVNVEIPFADRMASWGKRALIVAAIVIILVGLAAYWWFHPPINIHSTDTWMFVAVFILLPLFLLFWSKSHSYKNGTGKVEPNEGKAKAFKWASYLPVLVAVVGVLGAVASLSIFPGNAAKYVSQFEISPLYSQINYQSAPVRVSPLGYADLFKWFTNREGGIPAYALVNMTTQDAEIVKLGDSPIYYSESEPLVRNIDRHVQLSYPFYMFDQKSFEIDDDGHGYARCRRAPSACSAAPPSSAWSWWTPPRARRRTWPSRTCRSGSTTPIPPTCCLSSTTGRASTRTAG